MNKCIGQLRKMFMYANETVDSAANYLEALESHLRASTAELEAVLQSGENIARDDIERQIVVNKAVLGG